MDLEWSEGDLEHFYNLRENYSEHFDEERAKEIAKWLKDYQEEVYLDKPLEEKLFHEEAWEIASKTPPSGVSIEELTEAQLKRYQKLREEYFSETDALDIAVLFTNEQKQRYLELLTPLGPMTLGVWPQIMNLMKMMKMMKLKISRQTENLLMMCFHNQ